MSRFTDTDIEAVKASRMFDVEWYLEQYPDVKTLGMEPVKHYLWIGARLGRRPSPDFDPAEYAAANPDVEKAGLDPLLHYIYWGREEGRALSAKSSRQVAAPAGGNNGKRGTRPSPAGTASSAPPSSRRFTLGNMVQAVREKLDTAPRRQYEAIAAEFDKEYYLRNSPEVARAFAAGEFDLVKHYIDSGALEGLNPSPKFNTRYYLDRYPDVEESGLNPFYHYLQTGREEGRHPLPADGNTNSIPHYGGVFHNLVEAARSRTKPKGKSREYDVIRSEFDIAFYLARYGDIARALKLDPVQHYINAGAREGRDPSPYFCTKDYLKRYPEVEKSGVNPFYHWLSIGRDKGYISSPFKDFDTMCRMLDKSPREVSQLLSERYRSLRQRFERGTLGEMVARAAELEPLIANSWLEAIKIKLPPFNMDQTVSRISAMYALQENAGFQRAAAVVVVNRPRWGGGRRMEGYLAHALAEIHGAENVVVIASEVGGAMPPGKLPEGVRYIDLPGFIGDMKDRDRQRILVEFLRSLHPKTIFNVNSKLLWHSLKTYGKALSASSDIIGCMFCNELNQFGYSEGYPIQYFYRLFDTLAAVCTDSHFLADDLRRQYLVPPGQHGKIRVLEAPVDTGIALVSAPAPSATRRPQVFWSGRFDRQKRIDLVYKLARLMPDIDLRMWGEPVLGDKSFLQNKPDNVIHEGVYEQFSDLPLHEADLWLYTSQWDGVPSILLEVAMTGLPVVGSLAGGTGEVLLKDLSWPVKEINDIASYKKAIGEILQDPVAARKKARRLRKKLQASRTPRAYRKLIETIIEKGAS